MHVMEKLQNLRNLINLYIQLVLLQGFVTVHGHLNVKKRLLISRYCVTYHKKWVLKESIIQI